MKPEKPDKSEESEPSNDSRDKVDQIILSYLQAVDSGGFPDRDQLLAQNPDLATELRSFFAAQEDIRGLIGSPVLGDSTLGVDGIDAAHDLKHAIGREFKVLIDREAHDAEQPAPRYLIEEKVAEGGMGMIFRVYDRSLKRVVAMKLVKGGGASFGSGDTPESVGRFLSEAHVTAQLDHPGIVPVHELGVSGDRAYFTMTLVRGRPLGEVFQLARRETDGWNTSRAVGVLVTVCQALAYAHSKGIVHRDLKPDNVMVGEFGEVYVLDWGLAKVQGEKETVTPAPIDAVELSSEAAPSALPVVTADGSVMGTPAFMSPEQAAGKIAEVDQLSDVYALGCILYELLTGRPPYLAPGQRMSPRELVERVRTEPPPAVRDVDPSAPEELVAICEKAMARDRGDRYAGSFDLAEDLQAYLDGRVVRAHRTGVIAEFKKWSYRHRVTVRAAAVVGVAILVGAIIIGWILKVRQAGESLQAGLEHLGEYERSSEEITRLERAWIAARESLEPWVPVWYREEEIALDRSHRQARRERERRFFRAVVELANAVEVAPASKVRRVAEAALGTIFDKQYQQVLNGAGSTLSPEFYKAMVRALGLAAHADDLDRPGVVRLQSEPPGAEVFCFRYVNGEEARLLPRPFDRGSGEVVGQPFLSIEKIWDATTHQNVFRTGDRVVGIEDAAVATRLDLVQALREIGVDQRIRVRVSRMVKRAGSVLDTFPDGEHGCSTPGHRASGHWCWCTIET